MTKIKPKSRTPKTPVEGWLAAARRTLIDEGVAGVKVDRLAKRLGVTRGGFYHYFADRDELLLQLLAQWEAGNVFVPEAPIPRNPSEAIKALNALVDRLIDEESYDPRFDLAVRDWSRNDERAAWAVERVDARRIATLARLFLALGCEAPEADVRARVFYFHQIGYYAIGIKQTAAERRRLVPVYLRILIGTEHMDGSPEQSARQDWGASQYS